MDRYGLDDEQWLASEDADGDGEERSPIDTASLLIGAVAHAVQKAGPETTEHLVNAAHELMLAVRAFVRHFAEAITEGASDAPRASGPERIDILGTPAPARPAAPRTPTEQGPPERPGVSAGQLKPKQPPAPPTKPKPPPRGRGGGPGS